ncbi:MAG: hypothetical protein R2695_00615 [Acidimicrobiales bacterium]
MYLPTSEGGGSLVLFHFEDRDTPVNEERSSGSCPTTSTPSWRRPRSELWRATRGGAARMPEHGIRVGFVADPSLSKSWSRCSATGLRRRRPPSRAGNRMQLERPHSTTMAR